MNRFFTFFFFLLGAGAYAEVIPFNTTVNSQENGKYRPGNFCTRPVCHPDGNRPLYEGVSFGFPLVERTVPVRMTTVAHTKLEKAPGCRQGIAVLVNAADTIPPLIQCPPGDTVTLASGQCDTNYVYTVTAFDSLTELTPVQLEGLASGDPFPIGVTVNVFEVSDSAGNTATCSFTIAVTPAATTLVCADTVLVYLEPGCATTPALERLLAEPYGCLGDDFVIEVDKTEPFGNGPWSAATFGAPDVNQTYLFRITDTLSDEKCLGVVQIADSLVLALDCPEINVPCALPLAHLTPAFLKDSLNLAAGMPAVLQSCPSPVSTMFADVPTDVPCDSPGIVSGYIRRFWTAIDASNNVATCVQYINRERDVKAVSYPASATASCSGGDPLPAVSGEPYIQFGGRQYPLSESPLCEIEVTYSDSSGALCGGSRRLYRTWIARDTCSADSTQNTASGLQLIDVLDMDGPQFNCPSDTALTISAQECKGALAIPGIVVGDGCSRVTGVKAFWSIDGSPDSLEATLTDFPGNDPALSDTLAVFDTVAGFPAGVTQIVYVATDACGNTASCEIALSVWDSVPPVALCDSFLVVTLDTSGRFSLPADSLDNGSSDSCNTVGFKVRRVQANGCQPVNRFFNTADFCCTDVGDTILVQLRVYDVLLPSGEVDTAFAAGQWADCTARIWVRDTFPPFCVAPPDVIVACDSFDVSLAAYGNATVSCGIDSLAVQTDYSQFDSTCHAGKIVRTFTVFKTGGQNGQCAQEITVNATQSYWIRFPNDTIVTVCDSTGIYGQPELGNLNCENIKITFTDERIADAQDVCLKILRTWKLVNECLYDPGQPLTLVPNPNPEVPENNPANFPGPVIAPAGTPAPWAPTRTPVNAGDPDTLDYSIFWPANGYLYEQVIYIIDTDAPVFEDCPAAALTYEDFSSNDPQLWNDSYTTIPGSISQDLCEGETDLSIAITDACYGSDLDARYLLFLDLDGDGAPETVINSDNPPSAGDVLYNNINTPNYGGGIPKLMDNRQVAANNKYQFTVQRVIDGTKQTVRVAWNTPASPLSYIPSQLPLGNHRIEWTISDGCGNENTCAYDFAIEDAGGLCLPAQLPLGGIIETEANAPVNSVAVALDGTHPTLPPFNLFDLTEPSGMYDFIVPTGAGFTIRPFRSDNPLNGVSTFDLFLINKHVLGLDPLPTPFRLIAADANGSNTVTTFDIVELRKLLLGLYQELPNVPSWRFVDANYIFPNTINPLLGGFPDSARVADMQPWTPAAYNFTAVKVGDVNGSADPGFTSQEPEDRGLMPLLMENTLLRTGQTARIPVRLQGKTSLAGLQFALGYDPDVLSVQRVIPGNNLAAPGEFDQYYAFPEPGVLTLSWNGAQAAPAAENDPLFYLEVNALQAVEAGKAFSLKTQRLRPEIYTETGNSVFALQLEFVQDISVSQTVFFPPSPNPSDRRVYIPLALANEERVRVQVYDPAGRQLFGMEELLPAGFHRIEIPAEVFGQMKGVALYRIQAGEAQESGKISRQ